MQRNSGFDDIGRAAPGGRGRRRSTRGGGVSWWPHAGLRPRGARGAPRGFVVFLAIAALSGCTRFSGTQIASYGPYQRPDAVMQQAAGDVRTRGYTATPSTGGVAVPARERPGGTEHTFELQTLPGGYLQLTAAGRFVRRGGTGVLSMPAGLTSEYAELAANLLPSADAAPTGPEPPGIVNPRRTVSTPDWPLVGTGIGLLVAAAALVLALGAAENFGQESCTDYPGGGRACSSSSGATWAVWGGSFGGALTLSGAIMIAVGAARQDPVLSW